MCFTWHVGCEHVLRHDWHDFVQAQTPNTSNLLTKRTPNTSDLFTKRTPSLNTTAAFRNGFTPGLDVGIVAFLMTVYSFLWGLGSWACSGILRFFRMLGLEERRLRRVRFLPRRKESFLRIKVRDHWVRVSRDMKLSVLRRQPTCFESMLSCFAHVWHACVAWHVEGDDESTQAEEEPLRHRLRAVRGLPLPGKGSASDPFRVDPEEPARPAPLSKPSEPDVDDDLMPPAAPRQKSKPSLEEPPPDPNGPEDDEDLRVPLSSVSLYNHRSRGHFPFDSNCESCCASKGRVPARRLRRKLQKENQTIGLDFYYYGKLRVLLMMHVGSRYTVSLPAMHLDDPDLLHNINRVIREMGLVGKAVTFRMDQEAALGALAEKLSKAESSPASATLIDVVPGYRPQSKGSIERQVECMKQGFWAVWLDLEKEVAKAKQGSEAVELGKYQLPLGGMLWQARWTCPSE